MPHLVVELACIVNTLDMHQNKNENIFYGFRSFNSHITKQKLMNRYSLTANQSKITQNFHEISNFEILKNRTWQRKFFTRKHCIYNGPAEVFRKNFKIWNVCIFLQNMHFLSKIVPVRRSYFCVKCNDQFYFGIAGKHLYRNLSVNIYHFWSKFAAN